MTIPTKTTESPHWAATRGAEVAARRVAREAKQQASSNAEAPAPAIVAKRFAEVAMLVIDMIDHFATAAEIAVAAEPPSATSVRLSANALGDVLWLQLQDDDLLVTFRGRSRSEEVHVDLSLEAFVADTTARRIAEQWIKQLEMSEGGSHVTR